MYVFALFGRQGARTSAAHFYDTATTKRCGRVIYNLTLVLGGFLTTRLGIAAQPKLRTTSRTINEMLVIVIHTLYTSCLSFFRGGERRIRSP
jgi:hypothetical protein